MTIKVVACHLGASRDMIKEILKSDLSKRFGKPKLKHLQRIAIDEISVGRGHRDLTLVLDLDCAAIVPVGAGKDGEALKFCWKRRRSSGVRPAGGGSGCGQRIGLGRKGLARCRATLGTVF